MADEWLEVTQGPAAGTRLDVDRELAVGRAEPGPASLAGDRLLSRAHARFRRAVGGELIVEDLDSANGTYVGGQRLDGPAVLAVGDTVQLGVTTIVVRGARTITGAPPTGPQATRVRAPHPQDRPDAAAPERPVTAPAGGARRRPLPSGGRVRR
ncbi:MAG: FHA domain-containing protein, partial [Solirubrobacteraceae bacterium]